MIICCLASRNPENRKFNHEWVLKRVCWKCEVTMASATLHETARQQCPFGALPSACVYQWLCYIHPRCEFSRVCPHAGKCVKTIMDDTNPPLGYARFAPNGRYIMTCSLDSRIKLWDFDALKLLKTYDGETPPASV